MTEAHEPLDPPRRPIFLGAALTVAGIGLSVGVATFLLHEGRGHLRLVPGQVAAAAHRIPAEVNEVESAPFSLPTEAEQRAHADHTRLGRYGWVDAERQIVHLPIDVAIDLYLDAEGRR